MIWLCWFFHKWGSWGECVVFIQKYIQDDGKVTEVGTDKQKRVCLRCGKIGVRAI